MKAKIRIKPLSINDNCPVKKKAYFAEIERQLPKRVKLPKARLEIHYEFYISQDNSDLGNFEKRTTDAICKAWNIQDSNFYRIYLHRINVKAGKEQVKFKITKLGGANMEKLKPYAELIKFIIYNAIGAYGAYQFFLQAGMLA